MRDFFFPRKLKRLAYFVRAMPLNILTIVAAARFEDLAAPTGVDVMIWFGTVALLVYGIFFIYLPRMRDCGMSPWMLLLGLIPYVSNILGLLLLFRPSRLLVQTEAAADATDVPAIAGRLCSECGKPLILATDGVIGPSNKVLCHACQAASPSSTA